MLVVQCYKGLFGFNGLYVLIAGGCGLLTTIPICQEVPRM